MTLKGLFFQSKLYRFLIDLIEKIMTVDVNLLNFMNKNMKLNFPFEKVSHAFFIPSKFVFLDNHGFPISPFAIETLTCRKLMPSWSHSFDEKEKIHFSHFADLHLKQFKFQTN